MKDIINRKDLYVGMLFKPQYDDEIIYGECIELNNNDFTFVWRNTNDQTTTMTMSVAQALGCFNYYGWEVLSEIEKELL